MELTLEVMIGPSAGHKTILQPGRILRVGRAGGAELCVPFDLRMSVLHFTIVCDDRSCRLRDAGSTNGTFVNGQRVSEAFIREGDEITAGETIFVVRREEVKAAAPAPSRAVTEAAPPTVPQGEPQDLLDLLQNTSEPLFAIVDAARNPIRVLTWLQNCKEEYQSLYEGPKGDELAAAAPYLVSLPHGSAFVESLVREGWGNSWGIYLTSKEPFKEVRKHFRHFLLVKTEAGRELYFRFYDPRVLRVYLPTCSTEETGRFFGPITSYFVEAGSSDILVAYKRNGEGLSATAYPLLAAKAGATERS